MKWLALDTSSDALSVALGQGDRENVQIQKAFHEVLGPQHGVTLVPEIQKLLQAVAWKAQDIDCLVVGLGPGSYTGMRLGVTLAKIWSVSLKLDLYSVSSLALLAGQVEPDLDILIIPVVDARRMSAYTNIYRWTEDKLVSLFQDGHYDWEDWLSHIEPILQENPDQKIIFIGHQIQDFVDLFVDKFPDFRDQVEIIEGRYPDAGLAFTKGMMNPIKDPHTLAPNYAHPTLAEQEWAAKHQRSVANEEENERYIEHFL